MSMTTEAFMFSIFGDLPSVVIYTFKLTYDLSVTSFIGFLNISSILQIIMTTNYR